MDELDDIERARLFEHYGREYHAGDRLYREGEPGDVCYLLEQGKVRLVKRVRSIERSMAIIRAGEIFGEDALLEPSVRSTSAVALTDMTALALDRHTFGVMLQNNPTVAFRLIEQLVGRLHDAEEQLENTMLRDHPSRIVNTLLRLTAAMSPSSDGYHIDISPLDLSSRVGLDVQAVKRVVQQLREGGYLHIQEERMVITDREALRKLYDLLGVKEDVRGT